MSRLDPEHSRSPEPGMLGGRVNNRDAVLEDRVLVVVIVGDAVTDAQLDWRFVQRQCDALDFK